MRKVTIATVIVLVIAGAVAYLVMLGPMNPSKRIVHQLSLQFMEDVQFKDFRRSASYHHKLEKDRVDIGRTIEKLFLVKHEMLDIQDFNIIKSDIDDTGDRARVHIRTRAHRLNMKDEPEDKELILYWMKRHPECPIGATCESGICVNSDEEALYLDHGADKPLRESELEHRKKKRNERPPEKLTCDPNAEPRWFMNLDSTLKEKRYNY